MKKTIIKGFKKFLNNLGITPYVYYTYKYNNPLAFKKKMVGNKKITIFDVGAHDGRTIDLYKKHFPKSNIFSFEPTPKTFEVLVRKSSKHENVKIFNEALTDYIGTTDFHLNHSSLTNSILKSSDIKYNLSNVYETKEKITVKANTIDNFCLENKVDKIDLLKIDVQGADLQVLKGAENMLKNKKIELIFIEVEFVQVYQNQPLFHDVSLFLNEFEYRLFSLYNLSINTEGQMIYGDAIFVKNEK
jgi:FkbM family methyltransferase